MKGESGQENRQQGPREMSSQGKRRVATGKKARYEGQVELGDLD